MHVELYQAIPDHKAVVRAFLFIIPSVLLCSCASNQTGMLSSWNDTHARASIIDFVDQITGSQFVLLP